MDSSSREEDIDWLRSTFHPIPKPALPDDCIEYSLYLIDGRLDSKNDSETKTSLREIQKYANSLQKQWLSDYIWQRQAFNLALLKENGVSFLRGRTEYGDSIEDEWVVVWLLRELTKKHPNLWVKLTDTDGEFLLIEASGTLPAWLEPEVAENRVWINQGQLKIIKPAGSSWSSKRTDEKLTLEDARTIVISDSKRAMHSESIQEEAFYRLRDYPAKIAENMHNAIIRLPRKIAYLLLQKPAYVAPAIEAFYLRDPISLKPLQTKDTSKLAFPPNDLVEISVRFPRVAYAQLKSQDFPILDSWKKSMPPPSEPEARGRTETGMKLTYGFEMLLTDSQHQDKQHVREVELLLGDLESGDAALPTDADLAKLEKRADDEKWLDISFEDLQSELNRGKDKVDGSAGETTGGKGKKPEFGDRVAQENLQRIVKQFESFLNDDKTGDKASGMFDEGDSDTEDLDDVDSDDLEEDKEASFGEDEFTKLMEQMMGLPPEVMKEMMQGKIDALQNGAKPEGSGVAGRVSKEVEEVEELSSDDEDEVDDAQMEEHLRRMGVDLKGSGALDLSAGEPSGDESAITSGKQGGIVEELDSENDSENGEDDDNDPLDADDPFNQIDEELAKNLLEQFKAQGGISGPASDLMTMMAAQSVAGSKGKSKESSRGKVIAEELVEDVD